eukprot:SAG31_NODE_15596_length_747_cov_1.407407_2_plen_134_part_01
MTQAQHRYNRLMKAVGKEEYNRTIPPNEQVFRVLDPDAHLGGQRISDHVVPHQRRIEAERARVVAGTHVEGGPYSDKLNNMYMRNWDHGAYSFQKCYEAVGRSVEMRGRPSKFHQQVKTPWRSDSDYKQWQKSA